MHEIFPIYWTGTCMKFSQSTGKGHPPNVFACGSQNFKWTQHDPAGKLSQWGPRQKPGGKPEQSKLQENRRVQNTELTRLAWLVLGPIMPCLGLRLGFGSAWCVAPLALAWPGLACLALSCAGLGYVARRGAMLSCTLMCWPVRCWGGFGLAWLASCAGWGWACELRWCAAWRVATPLPMRKKWRSAAVQPGVPSPRPQKSRENSTKRPRKEKKSSGPPALVPLGKH